MKQINFALINIESKSTIAEQIIAKKHNLVFNGKIRNDKTAIGYNIHNLLRDDRVNVIITIGGADFKEDSLTIELVKDSLEKEINFDALLKQLYYEKYKAEALSVRSLAGTAKGKMIFCLPDDEKAIRIALEKLILAGIDSIFSQLS